VEYTHHPELYLLEQLGCARLAPLLGIRRWSKLAWLKPGYLLVVCLQFVIGDETLIQCRHPGHHCLLRLVQCPIQFHQICWSSGTHRCSHRSDELSLFVVVHLVPPQVHYTPWSVRSSFWRATRVVMWGVLWFVVGKNCDRTTVYRGTSAKVHICPLYLMRHVRDGGQNYQTPVDVWVIHTLINLG